MFTLAKVLWWHLMKFQQMLASHKISLFEHRECQCLLCINHYASDSSKFYSHQRNAVNSFVVYIAKESATFCYRLSKAHFNLLLRYTCVDFSPHIIIIKQHPFFSGEIHLSWVYFFTVLYPMLWCQPLQIPEKGWKYITALLHLFLSSEIIPVQVSCNRMHSSPSGIVAWLSYWVLQAFTYDISFLSAFSTT